MSSSPFFCISFVRFRSTLRLIGSRYSKNSYMNNKSILSVMAVISVIVCGCTKYEAIQPIGESNFFAGVYHPVNKLQQVSCSQHVEGVECGDYTLEDFLDMRWHWEKGRLDSIVYHDSRANTLEPFVVRYFYDSQNRVVRVEDPMHEVFSLEYGDGHLSSIQMSHGTMSYGFRFHYHNGSDYPDSLSVSSIGCFASTSDSYALRWHNGNLMAAVSKPGNDRYSLDSITYSYDNKKNPFCGFVPHDLESSGIVDAPLFISQCNLLSVTLHSHDGDGAYQSNTFQYHYKDNRLTEIVHQYENGFWCHVTDTYTLKY